MHFCCHLSIFFICCSLESSTYTGNPKGCRWSICSIWVVFENMGTKPSCILGSMFLIWWPFLLQTDLWRMTCSIMTLVLYCKSLMRLSALSFLWSALTPQYVNFCLGPWDHLKSLSANLLLSAWECSIINPKFTQIALKISCPFIVEIHMRSL